MEREGPEPNRERPEERTVFGMGDYGPFPGQAPSRSDEDIRRDVQTALFYDEAVSSIGINVEVQNGNVTLSGTVQSDLAKRAAGDDAWRVAGVRNVANNLVVHETPTPSRAAGQDAVAAKPPTELYGQPPEMPAGQPEAPKPAGAGATTPPSPGQK